LEKKKLLYTYPCKSNFLKTWQITSECDKIAEYFLTDVSHKLLALQLPSELYKQNSKRIFVCHYFIYNTIKTTYKYFVKIIRLTSFNKNVIFYLNKLNFF